MGVMEAAGAWTGPGMQGGPHGEVTMTECRGMSESLTGRARQPASRPPCTAPQDVASGSRAAELWTVAVWQPARTLLAAPRSEKKG